MLHPVNSGDKRQAAVIGVVGSCTPELDVALVLPPTTLLWVMSG
jgi:hypothetical protein